VERPVDDHHLRVIPRQIGGCPRHRDAAVQQPRLELPQVLLTAAIGVRDERADGDAAVHGRLQRLLELRPVEPEYDDID
jgi:hypothetical protein